jgi:hypothetical protein
LEDAGIVQCCEIIQNRISGKNDLRNELGCLRIHASTFKRVICELVNSKKKQEVIRSVCITLILEIRQDFSELTLGLEHCVKLRDDILLDLVVVLDVANYGTLEGQKFTSVALPRQEIKWTADVSIRSESRGSVAHVEGQHVLAEA